MKTNWKVLAVLIITVNWLFFSWLPVWQNLRIPQVAKDAQALNKVNNWDFATSATGWTGTNDNGTNVCGDDTSSTGDTAYTTFGYSSGTWTAITAASKNTNFRGKISQTVTAPGTGTIKAKGKLTYTSIGASWSAVNTSWIRLDLYDSSDTSFVASLVCVSFNADQSATASYGSDVNLTGGTTYAVRVTIRNRVGSSNAAITTTVDNIDVNFAPVGLSVSAPTDTTNAQLDWTASTAGTGAGGLHATTPYKVYRDLSSPVSTFLANSATDSYTDASTTGNTTYYYALTDYDTGSNESALSAETSVLTRPAAPTGMNFTNIASETVTVNWSAPSGGSPNYRIERAPDSGGSPGTWVEQGTTSDTFHNDSGLNGGVTYWYRVRGYNDTGNGVYSGNASVATSAQISISLTTDGTVNFGTIPVNTQKDTTSGANGINDLVTVSVDDGPADLDVKTSIFNQEGNNWTLGAADNGDNQVLWEYSKDGSNWSVFSAADPTSFVFDTNVPDNDLRSLFLRLNTPTATNSYLEYSSSVTIIASAP